MRALRGHVWFIRRFGLRTWLDYERVRRSGATFDYARIWNADERAILEEHMEEVPWR